MPGAPGCSRCARPRSSSTVGPSPSSVPPPQQQQNAAAQRSASGSTRVEGLRARTALPSRIWVEGVHDAALVERVWGHDLRVEGVVVEHLEGLDNLADRLVEFRPGPGRKVGVLVDHLVDRFQGGAADAGRSART